MNDNKLDPNFPRMWYLLPFGLVILAGLTAMLNGFILALIQILQLETIKIFHGGRFCFEWYISILIIGGMYLLWFITLTVGIKIIDATIKTLKQIQAMKNKLPKPLLEKNINPKYTCKR